MATRSVAPAPTSPLASHDPLQGDSKTLLRIKVLRLAHAGPETMQHIASTDVSGHSPMHPTAGLRLAAINEN
jgi:hypothetical protein